MNAIRFFLEEHAFTYNVPRDLVYAGLSDAQLRQVPHDGQNSLIWLLWHSARWEDFTTMLLDTGCPPVFNESDWLTRMNIDRRDGGTAMTRDECATFNAQVDVAGVQAYWNAVANRTCEAVQHLSPERLDEPVGEAQLRRVFDEGLIGSEGARWLEQWLANRTRAWCLSLIILHRAEHLLGEALSVRGQAGFPLGL